MGIAPSEASPPLFLNFARYPLLARALFSPRPTREKGMLSYPRSSPLVLGIQPPLTDSRPRRRSRESGILENGEEEDRRVQQLTLVVLPEGGCLAPDQVQPVSPCRFLGGGGLLGGARHLGLPVLLGLLLLLLKGLLGRLLLRRLLLRLRVHRARLRWLRARARLHRHVF